MAVERARGWWMGLEVERVVLVLWGISRKY